VDLEVGDATRPVLADGRASAPGDKTIRLEYEDVPVRAGRNRSRGAQNVVRTSAAPASTKKDLHSFWFWPSVRNGLDGTSPHKESPLSRFTRRVQTASRAFLDPDSIVAKSGNVAKGGQGVERVASQRLDESAQR
jgi:hypothetical protein